MSFTCGSNIPKGQRCEHCDIRWRQHGKSLCRTCDTGDTTSTQDRDRARLVRQRQIDQALQRANALPIEPRELTVDGQLWEVVWDGTV